MITDIDCMKHRKSTHLAGVDVETIIAEKGSCELTIKLAFYDTKVDVSGTKTDGYFLRFQEGVKDMLVNSGNRKKIAQIVRETRNLTAIESRNLTNWVGIKIKLLFDPTVKMMGQVVGGIVVDPYFREKPKKTLAEAKAEFAAVNSRESFVLAYKANTDFHQNSEIDAMIKDLSIKYPKPQ